MQMRYDKLIIHVLEKGRIVSLDNLVVATQSSICMLVPAR
jgi:hypothetical protein